MKTWLARIIRRVGVNALVTFALVWLALSLVASGLADIVRGLDLELALTLATLGVASGWLVAKTRLGVWSSLASLGALGIAIVFASVGNLSGKLFAWASALVLFFAQLQRGRVEFASVARGANELASAIGVLLARVNDWLRALIDRAPAFDPVATALVWGALIWICAVWAGWHVRRRAQPFHALLPAFALLAIPFAYSGTEPLIFAVLLLALLALMVIVGQSAREKNWRARGLDFSEEIRFDLALWSVPFIVVWVSVAAVMPSLSLQDLVQRAGEIGRTQNNNAPSFSDSFGLSAKPRAQTPFDGIVAPGLPRSHLIGAGPELSREVVMTIRTNDPKVASSDNAPRYYWLNSTYDVYFGVGWTTSGASIINYSANAPTRATSPAYHRLVQQRVSMVKPDGLMYAAGDVASADGEFSVAWRGDDDAFSASIAAPAYTVRTWLATASEEQLKSAGSNYPSVIRDRYLALPNSIPARVLALARDLTATEATPYDRARAIEKYLRAYPYTLDVPEPPSNRDVADYFLFDLQRGYCDYYATAFVVLARAAGLPARLAVGYATGRYDPAQGVYIVTAADAHSWAQVYFPTYGWIDFEPTGGRAELERVGDVELPEGAQPVEVPVGLGSLPLLAESYAWLAILFVLALLIAGALIYLSVDLWRVQRLAPRRAIGVLYQRLYQFHRRTSSRAQSGDTPYQVSARVRDEFDAWFQNSRWKNFFAGAPQDVARLAELYVRAAYSPSPPDVAARARAIRLWRQLRWRLWSVSLWQRVRGVRRINLR